MLKFFAIVFTFSLRAIFTCIEFRLAWGMRDGIFYNMSQNKLLNPPVRCTRHETVKTRAESLSKFVLVKLTIFLQSFDFDCNLPSVSEIVESGLAFGDQGWLL